MKHWDEMVRNADAYEAYLRELESGAAVAIPAPKLNWWKRAARWLQRRVS